MTTRDDLDAPFCSACSEPVAKIDGAWTHLDAAIGADCADRRGDWPIVPVAGRTAFSPLPYDPRQIVNGE